MSEPPKSAFSYDVNSEGLTNKTENNESKLTEQKSKEKMT